MKNWLLYFMFFSLSVQAMHEQNNDITDQSFTKISDCGDPAPEIIDETNAIAAQAYGVVNRGVCSCGFRAAEPNELFSHAYLCLKSKPMLQEKEPQQVDLEKENSQDICESALAALTEIRDSKPSPSDAQSGPVQSGSDKHNRDGLSLLMQAAEMLQPEDSDQENESDSSSLQSDEASAIIPSIITPLSFVSTVAHSIIKEDKPCSCGFYSKELNEVIDHLYQCPSRENFILQAGLSGQPAQALETVRAHRFDNTPQHKRCACNKYFDTSARLIKHVKKTHKKFGSFICPHPGCKIKRSGIHQILDHFIKHTNEDVKYTCNCGHSARFYASLISHTNSANKVLKIADTRCVCGFIAKDKNDLKAHLQQKHSITKKGHTAYFCGVEHCTVRRCVNHLTLIKHFHKMHPELFKAISEQTASSIENKKTSEPAIIDEQILLQDEEVSNAASSESEEEWEILEDWEDEDWNSSAKKVEESSIEAQETSAPILDASLSQDKSEQSADSESHHGIKRPFSALEESAIQSSNGSSPKNNEQERPSKAPKLWVFKEAEIKNPMPSPRAILPRSTPDVRTIQSSNASSQKSDTQESSSNVLKAWIFKKVAGATTIPLPKSVSPLSALEEKIILLGDASSQKNGAQENPSKVPQMLISQQVVGENSMPVPRPISRARHESINRQNDFGVTPLMAAVQLGDVKLAARLLDDGADTEIRDFANNSTALLQAVAARHHAMVELLLNRGADSSARNKMNDNALEIAYRFGYNTIIELLLKHAQNKSITKTQSSLPSSNKVIQTAIPSRVNNQEEKTGSEQSQEHLVPLLMKAAKANAVNLATRVLNIGVNVNVRDSHGNTALFYACQAEHYAIVLLLLNRGADVNLQGQAALAIACQLGNYKIANFLIGKGADVNARNALNQTPLMLASLWGRTSVAELLIREGADIHARDNSGQTALTLAAVSSHHAIVSIIKKRLTENPYIVSTIKGPLTESTQQVQNQSSISNKQMQTESVTVPATPIEQPSKQSQQRQIDIQPARSTQDLIKHLQEKHSTITTYASVYPHETISSGPPIKAHILAQPGVQEISQRPSVTSSNQAIIVPVTTVTEKNSNDKLESTTLPLDNKQVKPTAVSQQAVPERVTIDLTDDGDEPAPSNLPVTSRMSQKQSEGGNSMKPAAKPQTVSSNLMTTAQAVNSSGQSLASANRRTELSAMLNSLVTAMVRNNKPCYCGYANNKSAAIHLHLIGHLNTNSYALDKDIEEQAQTMLSSKEGCYCTFVSDDLRTLKLHIMKHLLEQ